MDDISYRGRDEVNRHLKQCVDAGRLAGEYVLMRKDRTPVPIRYKAFVFSDGCLAAIWEPIHDWRELYMRALLGVDPAELKHKAEIALAAIQAHISQSDASQTAEERQSIQDAVWALRALLKHSG